jgi:hypothetical protein
MARDGRVELGRRGWLAAVVAGALVVGSAGSALSQTQPGYFVLAHRMAQWFTQAEQRMSFYAAVADTVSLVSAMDKTPTAQRFAGCAPWPDLVGTIPFLTRSWYGTGERGLARVVVEQVLAACPGPGVDVVMDALIQVRFLDGALRKPELRQDGHLMLVGVHDAFLALYELEKWPGEAVSQFIRCARRVRTVDALVAAYESSRHMADSNSPAVAVVVLGVLRACIGR